MRGKRLIIVLLHAVVLTAWGLSAAWATQEAEAKKLMGCWQCQSGYGPIALEFRSANELVFDGENSYYTLAPGVIMVQEDYGVGQYFYKLNGGLLSLSFPDGSMLQCKKGKCGSNAASPGTPEPSGNTGVGVSGNNYLLQGMLCSYSGSSSSYSSYSSSTRVYFDGQGRFSVNSESSFSGDAGMYYNGGGGGNDGGGTYTVSGNKVYLNFSDGTRGVASVHMQQNDGRITEIMYEGTLYAAGLCG